MTQTLNTAEMLVRALQAQRLEIHTGLPGIVRSYDSSAQTAEIELALTRPLPARDEEDGEDTFETLPILPSVPVFWPRAGGFYLHWPLAAGDSGFVMFSELDMNSWRNTGDVSDPGVGLRHGLSGGVFMPGVFPRTSPNAFASGLHGRIGEEGGSFIEFRSDTDQIHAAGTSALALQTQMATELAKIIAALGSATAPSGGGPVTYSPPYTTDASIGTTKLKGS